MKVYISHASNFDFQTELYEVIESLEHPKAEFYLPHKYHKKPTLTRHIIENSRLVIAEVSFASTGQGIELGWANSANVPIICIRRPNHTVSSSIALVSRSTKVYHDKAHLKQILLSVVQQCDLYAEAN